MRTVNEGDRAELFNEWAEDYDEAVESAEDFPFAGYERVMAEIVRRAAVTPSMRVLDLGTGTGNLAERFVELGCEVWGVDFSAEMLARAREKVPQGHFLRANLLDSLPDELPPDFQRIVSGYVFHEFRLATKVELLKRVAAAHLVQDGLVVIGDIAFPTAEQRERVRQRWADVWDEEEHYWAADEAMVALARAGLDTEYRQSSFCAGVFIIRRAESR